MTDQHKMQEFESALRKDLCRMAQLGANISDAHSCFIFLPLTLISQEPDSSGAAPAHMLELFGCHSLSTAIAKGCRLSTDNGLIGWVARHHHSIHVSPFEHDSRTLGMYGIDQKLKSFIGIPIPLAEVLGKEKLELSGVIACDSRKSFAFSKLQGKLLEDLAFEIANTVALRFENTDRNPLDSGWDNFVSQTETLASSLGAHSIEVLRLSLNNFSEAEQKIGTGKAIDLLYQVVRLINQALPPYYPSYRLPSGDMIIALDQMMTGFFENKIKAMCEHVQSDGFKLSFSFARGALRHKALMNASLKQAMQFTSLLPRNSRLMLSSESSSTESSAQTKNKVAAIGTYGYRRA